MLWYRYDSRERRLTLALHVQPGARRNEIAGLHGELLKIRVAAPATDNQANAALTALLAAWFKVPRARVRIRHGAQGRRKIVEIIAPDAVAVAALPDDG